MTYKTSQQPNLRERSVKLADRIWTENGANPFISMMKGRGATDTAENQKVEWVNDLKQTVRIQVAPFDKETTLTINGLGETNENLQVGDILFCAETNEQMRVTQVLADKQKITVARGFGETEAQGVNNPTILQILSTAFAEGSNSPDGTVIYKGENYNYSQIFKHSMKITRNELKSPRYGEDGDKRIERRKKTTEIHKRAIERQLIFGERKKATDADGNDIYIAGGLVSFIKTNRIAIVGDFSLDKINEAMAACANAEASGDKVLLCGSNFLNAINKEGLSRVGGGAGAVIKKYGADITEVVTAYGKVEVVYHAVISQVNPNMAILVDMENVKYTTIDDVTLKLDIQEPDFDGVKDLVMSDCTIQVWNEETHAVIELC